MVSFGSFCKDFENSDLKRTTVICFQFVGSINFCVQFHLDFSLDYVEGCADLRIRFIRLFSYDVNLICLELWKPEKAVACSNSAPPKELCPVVSEEATVTDAATEEVQETLAKRDAVNLIEFRRSSFVSFCARACFTFAEAIVQEVKNCENFLPDVFYDVLFFMLDTPC